LTIGLQSQANGTSGDDRTILKNPTSDLRAKDTANREIIMILALLRRLLGRKSNSNRRSRYAHFTKKVVIKGHLKE
jgi:hypothetical protein